jgi:hypothetical protein
MVIGVASSKRHLPPATFAGRAGWQICRIGDPFDVELLKR